MPNQATGDHVWLVKCPEIGSKVIKYELVLGIESESRFMVDLTAGVGISVNYDMAKKTSQAYLTRIRPTAMFGVNSRLVKQGICTLPPPSAVIANLMILDIISPGNIGSIPLSFSTVLSEAVTFRADASVVAFIPVLGLAVYSTYDHTPAYRGEVRLTRRPSTTFDAAQSLQREIFPNFKSGTSSENETGARCLNTTDDIVAA